VSSFVFGYLIQRFQSYDAVLLSMAAALSAGAVLWLFIDASKVLVTPAALCESVDGK
jgi:hypothetical protein